MAFNIGNEKKQNRKSFADFLAFIFGMTVEDTKTPRNENEIDKITRDQDLFFISTQPNAHSPSKTYVWSIRTQALLFTITNLQTYRDIGNLRFYVGQATSLNDTTVAVFDRNSHQFITYFDFRKLRLATGAKDFVHLNPETKQIAFKTEGGLTRIFDETQNSFVGLLPDKIMQKLKGFETDMGTVLNQSVFMQASEALYQRDDFVQELARSLVPNSDDRVLQDTLMISSPGAGIDHVTQEFMNRWISGQIPESAAARIIFLRLDPTRMTADTTYRGQFADKISKFRSTAVELKNLGYQIVVVIEGLQNIDQTPHNFGEGDLFSSIFNLSHDRVISVLASISPAGFERLSRQKQEFMSLFKSQVRLEPLGVSATKRAILSYLDDHENGIQMNERQVDMVISQVQRLQQQRLLPGSAFRVIKALASDAHKIVTDKQIQEALARISGIPSMLLDHENFAAHYQTMLDYLNRRVVGQPSVIKSLVDSIFAFAQGNNRADLPIARLLLPGMTGTGKTELARALSEFLLSDPNALLKIDGANYSQNQDPLGLAKIIAQHVRKYPFCVLLIDEFEKMDVEARNIILSVADGMMTDEYGNPVSTALTITIATTNAGDEKAKAFIQKNQSIVSDIQLIDGIGEIFNSAVHEKFSPPILGRFDVIYPYRPLTPPELRGLIQDYLSSSQTLATESIRSRYLRRGIQLRFDASTVEYIANNFVNIQLGARRLTSQIEQKLVKEFLTPEELRGRIRVGGRYLIWSNEQGFQLSDDNGAARPSIGSASVH